MARDKLAPTLAILHRAGVSVTANPLKILWPNVSILSSCWLICKPLYKFSIFVTLRDPIRLRPRAVYRIWAGCFPAVWIKAQLSAGAGRPSHRRSEAVPRPVGSHRRQHPRLRRSTRTECTMTSARSSDCRSDPASWKASASKSSVADSSGTDATGRRPTNAPHAVKCCFENRRRTDFLEWRTGRVASALTKNINHTHTIVQTEPLQCRFAEQLEDLASPLGADCNLPESSLLGTNFAVQH